MRIGCKTGGPGDGVLYRGSHGQTVRVGRSERFSMLNSGSQQARKVFSAAMCKWRQRSILSIPKMSDK